MHKALKSCRDPNCAGLVSNGGRYCQQHKWNGSRHARGYDNDWVNIRNRFMSKPENQLCRMCLRHGKYVMATDCDHIIPFQGLSDPLRLDVSNLQPLCKACNGAKAKRR